MAFSSDTVAGGRLGRSAKRHVLLRFLRRRVFGRDMVAGG
jgi:hypothetical protein